MIQAEWWTHTKKRRNGKRNMCGENCVFAASVVLCIFQRRNENKWAEWMYTQCDTLSRCTDAEWKKLKCWKKENEEKIQQRSTQKRMERVRWTAIVVRETRKRATSTQWRQRAMNREEKNRDREKLTITMTTVTQRRQLSLLLQPKTKRYTTRWEKK